MISIIVPVYNVSQDLPRCIESILEQTYTDFELILVNDGSTDNSLEICQTYAENDKRIIIIDKANGGVSTARNAGILASKGEYIFFVDSDDYLRKDYVEDLILGAENDVDLVVAGFTRFKDKSISETAFPNLELVDKECKLLFSDFKFHKGCTPWGKLFKRSIIINHGIRFIKDIHFGEDTIFVFTYITKCRKVRLVDNTGYYYVQRSGSLTTKINDFNSERTGVIEFQKIKDQIIIQYNLNSEVIRKLNQSETIFLDRTKLASLKGAGYRNKYRRLSEIDWTILYNYKQYSSVKERLWDSLLAKKMFHSFLLLYYLLK